MFQMVQKQFQVGLLGYQGKKSASQGELYCGALLDRPPGQRSPVTPHRELAFVR